MVAAKQSNHVIDQIKNATGLVDVAVAESIELTPVLVLAVSLLYMMSSDGQIEEEESSQLQSVIGGNEALLSYAVAYVQRMPEDDFLKQAPSVLSTQDKLCILCNVCDSMLSDGRSEQAELNFFDKLRTAFGVAKGVFKPYFKAIELKNDKTVLGSFVNINSETVQITPHLVLAASLLYMMSADGSLGQEEIGQLETVIGEFDGLQKAALAYVRAVKREDFFKQASPVLNKAQKLCVLTNVCDSMMSDGVVAVVEDKLFLSMMAALGVEVAEFDELHKALETKNFKPFDISKFENRTSHTRSAGVAGAEGEVFDTTNAESELGIEVRRTMHDNIERVQQDFGSQTNVIQVNHNAIDDLNVQKIDADANTDPNRQAISATQAAVNRQSIDTSVSANSPQWISAPTNKANQQKLATVATDASNVPLASLTGVPNLQTLDVQATDVNRQALDVETPSNHLELLPPEVRVKNLFENIEVLTQQLDEFEAKHRKILQAGKQARLQQESQKKAVSESLDPHVLPLPPEAISDRLAGANSPVSLNIQSVGVDVFQRHQERLPDTQPLSDARDVPASENADNADSLTGQQVVMSALTQTSETEIEMPVPADTVISSLKAPRRSLRERETPALGIRWDWRTYLKVATTFVVLSCWTSNIAAIHLSHPKIATGKLVRLSSLADTSAPQVVVSRADF